MSTIVAVRDKSNVSMAWDTGTVARSTRLFNAAPRPKACRIGESLIGMAGLAVYYNLIQAYSAEKQSIEMVDESTVFQFFIRFWRWMREEAHFVDDGSDRDTPSPFADLCAEFIVANRTGLYYVKEILSVSFHEKFCAIGSGASHAEGALAAFESSKMTANVIAKRAVEIACRFDADSCGEIEVLSL